jgi:iron complex outermembrane recepter protein
LSFLHYRRAILSSTAISLSLGCIVAPEAFAQDTTDATVLEQIVVTGRKRDETDARLPMSTTILTEQQVPPSTLDTAAAIARQSPGTNFTDFARFGDSYLTMRGVATLSSPQNPLDSTVGFSLNGVPTSLSALNAPLLDVDHIEVLQGPQGTTFGRNALAGSINVVSKPADGTRDFRLDSEVGSDGYGFVQGTAGGWIVPDTIAGRGVLRFQKFDGDIPNTVIGGTDGGARVGAGQATLRITPDDTLTIDASAGFSRNERNDPSNILLETPDFPTSGADIRPFNQQKIAHGTVKASKDFDTFRFTSVTSYQDIRVNSENDYTDSLLFARVTGFPGFVFADPTTDYAISRERERAFNQEFRLNSLQGEPVQWVAGVSYFKSDYAYRRNVLTTYWPNADGTNDNKIDSQTIALFGDASIPLDEKWEISGGLRLAHDRQDLSARYLATGNSAFVPSFSQDSSVSDTYLTGRAALSYKWTDDVMTYGSIARGYASGGFEKTTQYAAYGAATAAFKPATSWTYELGTKAQLTDTVRVNGSVFYNDVSDGQLGTFDTSTFIVSFDNQDYRSYGLQLGATAEILDGLELNGGFAAIKSELVNVAPGTTTGAVDGNKVPQIPSFSANLGLQYRFDAESLGVPGQFTASADYQYVSSRYADVANTGKMDAYHIVNTRLSWEKDNFTIYAFANNLFDERPVHYAVPIGVGTSTAYVGRGRVVGLGSSIKW